MTDKSKEAAMAEFVEWAEAQWGRPTAEERARADEIVEASRRLDIPAR